MRFLSAVMATVVFSLLSSTTTWADNYQIVFPSEIQGEPRKGLLPETFRTFEQVIVGKSIIEHVKIYFGNTIIYIPNERESADQFVCYESPSGQSVLFKSWIAGSGSTVKAILFTEPTAYRNENCLKSDRLTRPFQLNGISLGLAKKDVIRLLGPPTFSDERVTEFAYTAKDPSDDVPDIHRILSGIRFQFDSRNRVNAFEVYQYYSNT